MWPTTGWMMTRRVAAATSYLQDLLQCYSKQELTLAAALNKMAHLFRIWYFEDDIDSSISVMALHLTSEDLDFTFKSETGPGGLRCWHKQSFMPSTASSIHYDSIEIDDWQFSRCALWATGVSLRQLALMCHCCAYLSTACALMRRAAFCRHVPVPITFRSLMGSELSAVNDSDRATIGMIQPQTELTFALVGSECSLIHSP